MHANPQSLILATLLGSAALALAAPLELGTRIGIDFGPTPTVHWNNITSNNAGIAAGSVIDLGGTVIDGVSITVANVAFTNGDGSDNWSGLATRGGTAPPEFVDSVTTDITGNGGNASPVTITLAGLDASLHYKITAVASAGVATDRVDSFAVAGDVNHGPSAILRSTAHNFGAFHTFNNVGADSSGTLVISVADTSGNNNPIVNGILIVAMEPEPPTPTGTPDRVWQIDFQGGPGGAFGSANPITATHDAGDGPTWNAFQIAATNDKALTLPWPNPAHNAAIDPQLTGLLDGTGAATGVDLQITGKASGYNGGSTMARGGIDHAYGDHWFFGQQGNCSVNLDFEFSGLKPGLYQLTAVVNPSPHNPPRDLYFKIGGVRHDIIPVSAGGGYSVAGTFDATIEGLSDFSSPKRTASSGKSRTSAPVPRRDACSWTSPIRCGRWRAAANSTATPRWESNPSPSTRISPGEIPMFS